MLVNEKDPLNHTKKHENLMSLETLGVVSCELVDRSLVFLHPIVERLARGAATECRPYNVVRRPCIMPTNLLIVDFSSVWTKPDACA